MKMLLQNLDVYFEMLKILNVFLKSCSGFEATLINGFIISSGHGPRGRSHS